MKRKRLLPFLLCLPIALLVGGCGGRGSKGLFSALKPEKVVGDDIQAEDITEFVYTFENINYNAKYRRYRFFTEDGKYLFFHETRERPDEYGPTTPEDTTASGTVELTGEEWDSFFETLRGGTVRKRKDGTETGGYGPWTYLYWKNDKNKYRQFEFRDPSARFAFEALCVSLAERSDGN
ncbi:MAG: hypothetical protein IJL26_05415 [Clostridia bacterium]|nr:hypothetical protein [Clostridia bacterium]